MTSAKPQSRPEDGLDSSRDAKFPHCQGSGVPIVVLALKDTMDEDRPRRNDQDATAKNFGPDAMGAEKFILRVTIHVVCSGDQ